MMKTLKEELLEYEDKYLRVLAELDNYKKRVQKERNGILESATERLVQELLVVLDDFERCLSALKDVRSKNSEPELVSGDSGDEFYKGVELIYNKLLIILEHEGLKSFSVVGELFDPKFHEAVVVSNSSEHPPNYVVAEVSKGYKLRDKVIRAAKVVVNQR